MEKLYSLEELEAISDGDEAFIATMKQIFEEEMLISLEKMNKAFTDGDLNTIRITAHTMKPSIDNLHINSVRNEVRLLESLAASNSPLDELLPLAQKVEAAVRAVIADMKTTE
ncbi:MAG TPA: Hpt domain-containing protein [Chitinophagaceae bacterium]|nr:Hpt domain-containing protein [Chitinophagaceae bacterium]